MEFLREWLDDETKGSRSMNDTQLIMRSMGKQIVLERILGLRDELREYGKKQLDKLNEGQGG